MAFSCAIVPTHSKDAVKVGFGVASMTGADIGAATCFISTGTLEATPFVI